jgi:SAM-dependent methyltransferase
MKKTSGFNTNKNKTHAAHVAREDLNFHQNNPGRRFSSGTRPVIRWIKGDGLDDMVTRAAIGQATRLFGYEVDYCLCTQGINASRVRSILEWADQPVEWWPVSEEDNPELACFLIDAGCPPENFGYWWKWFPERVRPDAPEWILDGDMVITGKPDWYQRWVEGKDIVRLSQDDSESPWIYGKYARLVDTELMLYSGLVSLPPKCRYMPHLAEVLAEQPLSNGHNGKVDMDEQGVIAATFQIMNASPVPLYEFPFCLATEHSIKYGLKGDLGCAWGYHFGRAFVMANALFDFLTIEKIVFSKDDSTLPEKFRWLGNFGQWGIPGWSMTDGCTEIILQYANSFAGKNVLELGTSRGRLTAMLATLGCKVTSVDHHDRGAADNLDGLAVTVVVDDIVHFMNTSNQFFDLVICDMHGNSPRDWERNLKPLMRLVKQGSTLIINNYLLNKIPEWHEEKGVAWFLKQLPRRWNVTLYEDNIPGIAIVTNDFRIEINNKIRTFSKWFSGIFTKQDNPFRFLYVDFIRKHLQIIRNTRMIKQSSLFSESYYLQNNPDVANSGMNPARHYLLYGGFEGRNPSEKFDSSFYLDQNPDVKASGMNPLVHYIRFGKDENRNATFGQSKTGIADDSNIIAKNAKNKWKYEVHLMEGVASSSCQVRYFDQSIKSKYSYGNAIAHWEKEIQDFWKHYNDRFYEFFILSGKIKKGHILDVGAEFYNKYIKEVIAFGQEFTILDLKEKDHPDIEIIKDLDHYYKFDMTLDDYRKNPDLIGKFDTVLSFGVLSYYDITPIMCAKYLDNLNGFLKPGGLAIIKVDRHAILKHTHFPPFGKLHELIRSSFTISGIDILVSDTEEYVFYYCLKCTSE